jgi:hypothetical protein
MMKFSRAISRVKWLSGEKTNVSKTISVLVLRVLVCLRSGKGGGGCWSVEIQTRLRAGRLRFSSQLWAHLAHYPMGTLDSYPEGIAAGV